MLAMGVFEAASNLTSFRDCRDETIPRKTMGKILESGRLAPSPGNVQSLEFIVVEGDHRKEQLSQIVGDERVEQAPTSVIVIGDIERMARRVGKQKSHDFCNSEAASAVQNMRLTAAEQEISSCWITGFDRQILGDTFDVPSGKEPLGVVIFGYSDNPVPKSTKFGLNEICFYDEYGNQINSAFDGMEWPGIRDATKIYGKKGKGLIDKIRRRLSKFL